jgi:predicted ribosomally synthesized peptide with nif11-like leader
MSIQAVRQFFESVSLDESLQEKVKTVTKPKRIVKIARESGYKFTTKEFYEGIQELKALQERNTEFVRRSTGGILAIPNDVAGLDYFTSSLLECNSLSIEDALFLWLRQGSERLNDLIEQVTRAIAYLFNKLPAFLWAIIIVGSIRLFETSEYGQIIINWLGIDSFISIVESFSILVAVFLYLKEAPERKKRAQYEAWRVINSAHGKGGSGGRIQALEDLNKDGVSLAGLTVHKAYLAKINLKNAELAEANLFKANLSNAVLQGAKLYKANLEEAILDEANLRGAYLYKANLQKAILFRAELQGAVLTEADLQKANLSWTQLQKATLKCANLQEAQLIKADLQEADLLGSKLQKAQLNGANFKGAKLFGVELQEANLSTANFQDAKLSQANLQRAGLWGANLQRADLRRANLQGAYLAEAQPNFKEADLNQADLNQADLRGTDLNVDQVKCAKNWEKAKYDEDFREKLGLPKFP